MQRLTTVLGRLQLRTKLLAGFLTVVLLMVGVGLVAQSGLRSENRASDDLFAAGRSRSSACTR